MASFYFFLSIYTKPQPPPSTPLYTLFIHFIQNAPNVVCVVFPLVPHGGQVDRTAGGPSVKDGKRVYFLLLLYIELLKTEVRYVLYKLNVT